MGFGNIGIGWEALKNNVRGDYNLAIGVGALKNNGGGDKNIAIGYRSLHNTESSRNIGIGQYALYRNTEGYNNTASGDYALYENTTGAENIALGRSALYRNTTGSYNTAIGRSALLANETRDYNTAIGSFANISSATLSNATAIGSRAMVNASNKVRLGNSDVTVIEGQVAFSNASDERIKTNITETKYGLKTALSLKPVDYTMISNEQRNVGFIAQDVQKLVPEAVSGVEGDLEKGETLSIAYTTLIPVLTKAIQEQNEVMEKQSKMIAALQKEVDMLKKKI